MSIVGSSALIGGKSCVVAVAATNANRSLRFAPSMFQIHRYYESQKCGSLRIVQTSVTSDRKEINENVRIMLIVLLEI